MRKNRYFELLRGVNYPNLPVTTNCSSLFLLPSLNLSSLKQVKIHKNYIPIENSYSILVTFGLKSINSYWIHEEYKDCLFLLFNPPEKVLLNNFHLIYSHLSKLSNFVDMLQISLGLVLIVMRIEKKWVDLGLQDIIMQGKFSTVPKAYLNFFMPSSGTLHQFKVITQDDVLRRELEMELDVILPEGCEIESVPDRDLETLKIIPIEI